MEDELFSFKDTLDRLKTATGAKTDSALANRLGVGQGSISSAKGKRQIPPSWLLRAANDYLVSLDWLCYGVGPMKRGGTLEVANGTRVATCPRCEKLESELEKERNLNRDLVVENRQLWRENGDLRVELAEIKARSAPDNATLEDARNCA